MAIMTKMTKKGLSDKRISEITGIPYITICQWKKDKESYRIKLYWFLKTCDESVLIENFKDFRKIDS